jgi:hypothetical protein
MNTSSAGERAKRLLETDTRKPSELNPTQRWLRRRLQKRVREFGLSTSNKGESK